MHIKQSLQQLRQLIETESARYNRNATDIKIIAVSKKQSIKSIEQAISAGQYIFAESYVQEALAKIQNLNRPELQWHFIGPIQSNKTAKIAQHFDWVHSIDRLKIAQRLNEQRATSLPALNVLIQVNISNEASKAGISPEQLPQLAQDIISMSNLRLRGLMVMPRQTTDYKLQRQSFAQTRLLLNELKQSLATKLDFSLAGLLDNLSMGTSNDIPAAIAEGATMIRPGTLIFGSRD